jgi:aldehyde reductase
MAASLVPKFKLNNGKEFPAVGLGTWQAPKGVVKEAVKNAIDVGYRHLDCAYAYQNEEEVGEAIAEKIAEGKIKREDLFITSKLWNTFHSHDKVTECLKATLKNLRLDYLDLYLIHWPFGYKEGGEIFPKDANGKFLSSNVDFVESWKAMEEYAEKGLLKSIGLSNFNSQQIDRIIGIAKIKPTVLQVECHPYNNQEQLIQFCAERGIVVTAYSPLGSPENPWAKEGDDQPLKNPVIIKIAEKHKKTPGKVLLKYQLQRNVVVIPKSVHRERLEQNIDLFDFKLDGDDMKEINSLNKKDGRICHLNWMRDHPHYPFGIPF